MDHGMIIPVPLPTNPSNRNLPLTKSTIKKIILSATFWLLIAQVVVFILAIVLSEGLISPALNATLGPSRCALIDMGAKFSPFIIHKLEYWRLLSANFIHSGFITLIVSSILEVFLIFPVEVEHGRLISIFVFIVSGATGNIFSCIATPTSVSTGALSACMGFVGFRLSRAVLDWPSTNHRRVGPVEAASALVAMIVGQSPFVDNYASFAGFVMGSFIGGSFFASKVDSSIASQRLVISMGTLAAVFVLFVCTFLMAAGRFPLIDQMLRSEVCVPSNSVYEYL